MDCYVEETFEDIHSMESSNVENLKAMIVRLENEVYSLHSRIDAVHARDFHVEFHARLLELDEKYSKKMQEIEARVSARSEDFILKELRKRVGEFNLR